MNSRAISTQSVIQGVVPPYLLKNIMENGSTEERRLAEQTLDSDRTFREQRAQMMQGSLNLSGESQSSIRPNHPDCETLERTIFDAKNKLRTPGQLVRTEGQSPVNDPAVDEVYDALKVVNDFFCKVYARSPLIHDYRLEATVHYGINYANAFWDHAGERIVFGDGDGVYFRRFSVAVDIIAHELTHGVIAAEARLEYRDQPGALSESIADIFGCLCKQYMLQQTVDQADWLVGAGIYTSKVQGIALRSLSDPGSAYNDPVLKKDPQTKHMDDFVRSENTFDGDYGGVHYNSGIPSHAFYLAAKGVGGFGWENLGRVWYNTLCDKALKRDFGFYRFANLTLKHAVKLFGKDSNVTTAIKEGWEAVGIEVKTS